MAKTHCGPRLETDDGPLWDPAVRPPLETDGGPQLETDDGPLLVLQPRPAVDFTTAVQSKKWLHSRN